MNEVKPRETRPMNAKRILKKHIGRWVKFVGNPERPPIDGLVTEVKNGMAEIRYWNATLTDGVADRCGNEIGYRTLLPVRSPAVIEIY